VIFKQNLSITLATLLQAVVPPIIVFASFYFTVVFYRGTFSQSYQLLSVIMVAVSIILLRPSISMTQHLLIRRVPLVAGIIVRWLALLGTLLALGYATKLSSEFSRRIVLTWAFITPLFLIIGSFLLRELVRRLLMEPSNARSVVFAGCNDSSLALCERLNTNSELCMKVAGFFDDRSEERLSVPNGTKLMGGLTDLAAYVRKHNIEVIFISLPIRHVRRVMDLLDELRDTTASIYYVPDILVFDLIQGRASEIMGIPVISMCETPFHGMPGITKRVTDVVLSLLILIPALPIMLAIAIIVKASSPGPAIFKQRRYGLDGREITVYKFRTMFVMEDSGQIAQATKGDERITPIGRTLRRTSLDELPQLFNVLQGRMSLVGPRPHAVAHNEEYRKLIKGYMLRHKVLPGITGLAQVNGCRGETARIEDMQARVNYDLDYLRHWSPILDMKILILTVLRLLGDERAY